MRVLLAPDCFGGTLSAPAAAQALADGWTRSRPGDELVLLPMSDGGPGFLDALPGSPVSVLVQDPLGRPTLATWLLDGTTAYIESAQACGLHLLDPAERDPGVTTTYGVGQLVRAAVEAGATRIVLGLGGSATNDGGAGLLAALGVVSEDAAGPLAPGGLALARAVRLVGEPALRGVVLVAATDVDHPLLGPHGATACFAAQKGPLSPYPGSADELEAALAHWADLVEKRLSVQVRDLPGAGAAGGLGFALLALGGTRRSGVELVAEAVGLGAELARADLVVTGEGTFDASSLRGKVVGGVARAALAAGVPCVVLAGVVADEVASGVASGERVSDVAGVEASYSLVEEVGRERALTAPAEALATLAARIAGQWSV